MSETIKPRIVGPGDRVDAWIDGGLEENVEVVAVTPEACFVRLETGKVEAAFWPEVSVPALPCFPVDNEAFGARYDRGELMKVYQHDDGFRVVVREMLKRPPNCRTFIGPRLADLIREASDWARGEFLKSNERGAA
jgi:hypothetical protein